jgi:3',5'-cyclic AMP phosphodiesterase CpdA
MPLFVLAHLSDPHLGSMPRPSAGELFSKRVIGFYNWHRRRKSVHRKDVVDSLVADLRVQNPDHIAVTGDLVNIALAAEFPPARKWLDTLGTADHVTFVPGNHDFYVRRAARQPHSHWGDFMRGDAQMPDEFPFVRRRGDVAIIGASRAIPTPLFMATGALGEKQIARLANILDELGKEGVFRVVLIHHPPVSKPSHRFKRLIDARAFRTMLKAHGAELVLHGHDHVHSVVFLEGRDGLIPAVGVPSASVMGGESDPAAYNLYRITGTKGAWRCEAISRGFRRQPEHAIGAVEELTRRELLAG